MRSSSLSVRAALVYGGETDELSGEMGSLYIFAETLPCDTDLGALYTLLQITMKRMDGLWGAHVNLAPGATQHADAMGHGFMYD
jgi:hypothetical protein